jgi:DNA-directed RNA polymerase II subunit RPB9
VWDFSGRPVVFHPGQHSPCLAALRCAQMADAEAAGPKFGGLITDTGLKERQNPSYICPSCGNMLWNFKNDGSKLTRVCRNCGHADDMESNLVYVNDVKFAGGTDHVASADMVKDPTLPRATNVQCNSCNFNEAVFFQKPMRGDEGMKLIFMCIRCSRGSPPRASVRARHPPPYRCAHTMRRCAYKWEQ